MIRLNASFRHETPPSSHVSPSIIGESSTFRKAPSNARPFGRLWSATYVKDARRLAQSGEKLIRLKTRTGIPHWNVLCRWAFCLSLRQASPPAPLEISADSNVEMTWQVFGGDAHEMTWLCSKSTVNVTGWGRRKRCWPDSFGCICIEGSATWPRRRRFGRLGI